MGSGVQVPSPPPTLSDLKFEIPDLELATELEHSKGEKQLGGQPV